MNTNICIWHGSCIDGWGSAMALYHKIPDAEFFKGVYNDAPPDVAGKNVWLVDFSYRREVVEKMLETAKHVTIIDHHVSAMKDLEGLVHPNLTKVFDMTHSGAVLTWITLFPSQKVPQVLLHIEDRDLWRFKLADTNEICAALYSHEFDIETWIPFFTSHGVDELYRDGVPLVRARAKNIRDTLKHTHQYISIDGHRVPIINCPPAIASEVGNELSSGYDFAVTYMDVNDSRIFSLRSSGDFDVSQVAFKFGGGGHKAAAGFKIKLGAFII